MAESADLTKLDKDLAAAKERVAAKRARNGTPPESERKSKATPAAASAKSTRRKLSDEEKGKRQQAHEEKRSAAKAQREERKEKRRAERESLRPTPHLSKVEKAAEQLPDLTEAAAQLYEKLRKDLTPSDMGALGAHLQHAYRTHMTTEASKRKLVKGQKVRLVGGPSRYRGKVGTVDALQRIRCYVKITGVESPVYVFTSETEDVATA